MNAIEITGLSKNYDGFSLENVSFSLPSGSIMGLVGENGAGKSTTIKLIMNAAAASGGSVKVLGCDNRSDEFTDLKNDIGVVLDEAYFPEILNAKNVAAVMKDTYRNWSEYVFEDYDFDIWTNRGVGYKGMDDFFGIDMNDFYLSESELSAKLVGTNPTEYGFMSMGVSKGYGFDRDIKLNVYVPKGTKMMYAEPFSAFGNGDGHSWNGVSKQSSFGHEAEMILQRGTQFRVTKVEKSNEKWYIDMEVIGQSH